MWNRVKLVKILFSGVVVVGLYEIMIVFHFSSRFYYKTWKKEGLPNNENVAEDDENIQLENIQFNGLSKHKWVKHCQISFEQLCNYPIFPKAPDERNLVENVNITRRLMKLMAFSFLASFDHKQLANIFSLLHQKVLPKFGLVQTRTGRMPRRLRI